MGKINICLAGVCNVGKSSLFNILTGLKQHTGNWPGKTVDNLVGNYKYNDYKINIVDVPGTYSLYGYSEEEIIARDYICFNKIDCLVFVADPFSIEKSLNLLFQILEYHKNVILVINLIDEASKKGIIINKLALMYHLGIPVVNTSCRKNIGIKELNDTIIEVYENRFHFNHIKIDYGIELENLPLINTFFSKNTTTMRLIDCDKSFIDSIVKYGNDELKQDFINFLNNQDQQKIREKITETNFLKANYIKNTCFKYTDDPLKKDKNIDKILTSKKIGIPIMILLLSLILYITISFANIPSTFLFNLLFSFEEHILNFLYRTNIPTSIINFFVLGILRTTFWVVAVMLPPMAIFFPLFTFLEDLGYLPRIAYNLDYLFKKANCHGKQSLSMCMGFGCNAAAISTTKIIDSPKSKLIAILTNTFIPCNGRFPTFILITSMFLVTNFSYNLNNILNAFFISFFICFGVIVTLLISKLLSKYLSKDFTDTFTLELPPYRRPNIIRIIHRSIIERTIKLLLRAIKISALFGGVIFILANIKINDSNLINYLSNFLDPFGNLLGLDGVIILAFILALPANEILIPLIIMLYTNSTYLTDYTSITSLKELLLENNWTILTAINILLFSLLHFPCATTLYTIKKETNSLKYTTLAFIIPSIVAIFVCFTTNLIINLF